MYFTHTHHRHTPHTQTNHTHTTQTHITHTQNTPHTQTTHITNRQINAPKDCDFTREEIRRVTEGMDNKKAPDEDGITAEIHKQTFN